MAGLGMLLALAFATGCSSPPPPPKPVVTPIAMTLAAGADANPDARGRASPLTVRVYALKTSGAFEAADFFSLFEKDQATLGAEMAQREELLLRPGDSKKIEMTLAADIKAIGVMAAYRDLDRARWREVRAIEPGKPLLVGVNFGARQIQIRIDPAPPPPAPKK
jgi:type VI secretion system protein VasD